MSGIDTWSEAWRHECEVRFVCDLSKAGRDRYFAGDGERMRPLSHHRGEAAAARLRADAVALFEARKQTRNPHLPRAEGAATTSLASSGERTNAVPGNGSFPPTCAEGPLRRVGWVGSEGAAR